MEAPPTATTPPKTSRVRFDASYAFTVGGILKFLQIVSVSM